MAGSATCKHSKTVLSFKGSLKTKRASLFSLFKQEKLRFFSSDFWISSPKLRNAPLTFYCRNPGVITLLSTLTFQEKGVTVFFSFSTALALSLSLSLPPTGNVFKSLQLMCNKQEKKWAVNMSSDYHQLSNNWESTAGLSRPERLCLELNANALMSNRRVHNLSLTC